MKRKKTFSLFITLLIAITITGVISPLRATLAVTDEYAWYPLPTMYITQIAYESYSHGSVNAIDAVGGDYLFAPFTGKIVDVQLACTATLFQSLDKVYYANGDYDYMTIMLMHGSNYSELVDNMNNKTIIAQGTDFYKLGRIGNGGTPVVDIGEHYDIQAYKGKLNKITGKLSVDQAGATVLYAYDAFFINSEITKEIKNEGIMEAKNKICKEGAKDNYTGLWKTYHKWQDGGTCSICGATFKYVEDKYDRTMVTKTNNIKAYATPYSKKANGNSASIGKIAVINTKIATSFKTKNAFDNLWYKAKVTLDGEKAAKWVWIYSGDLTPYNLSSSLSKQYNVKETSFSIDYTYKNQSNMIVSEYGVDVYKGSQLVKKLTSNGAVCWDIKALNPNTEYIVKPYLIADGVRYEGSARTVTTKSGNEIITAAPPVLKSGSTVSSPDSTLQITGATTPGTLKEGSVFSVRGTVSSNYNIKSITVGVYNSSGTAETEKTIYFNEKSYDLKNIDAYILFNKVSAGNKTYRIVATDEKQTKTLLSHSYTVTSNATTPTVSPTAAASESIQYYKIPSTSTNSITDALKSIGEDGSYAHRARIAAANGITGYSGTAEQNSTMRNLLYNGKLIKAD